MLFYTIPEDMNQAYFIFQMNNKYASNEMFHSLPVMNLLVLKFKVTSKYAYRLCIPNFTCLLCKNQSIQHFNIQNQVVCARIKHQFYKELSTHYNTSCLQKHPTHHTSKSSLQLDQQQKHNAQKPKDI